MAECEAPFDRFADRFDAWYESDRGSVPYQLELDCLRPLWPAGEHPRLEVGVGTGRFASVLGAEVGIDPAGLALRRAVSRGVTTVRGVGEVLPFRAHAFAAVLMVGTLCFSDSPLALLAEARRVLASGGALLIGVVPLDSPWGRRYLEMGRAGDPFYAGARLATVAAVEELVEAAGFGVEAVRSTLLYAPDEEQRDGVVAGLVGGAGFVALRAAAR